MDIRSFFALKSSKTASTEKRSDKGKEHNDTSKTASTEKLSGKGREHNNNGGQAGMAKVKALPRARKSDCEKKEGKTIIDVKKKTSDKRKGTSKTKNVEAVKTSDILSDCDVSVINGESKEKSKNSRANSSISKTRAWKEVKGEPALKRKSRIRTSMLDSDDEIIEVFEKKSKSDSKDYEDKSDQKGEKNAEKSLQTTDHETDGRKGSIKRKEISSESLSSEEEAPEKKVVRRKSVKKQKPLDSDDENAITSFFKCSNNKFSSVSKKKIDKGNTKSLVNVSQYFSDSIKCVRHVKNRVELLEELQSDDDVMMSVDLQGKSTDKDVLKPVNKKTPPKQKRISPIKANDTSSILKLTSPRKKKEINKLNTVESATRGEPVEGAAKGEPVEGAAKGERIEGAAKGEPVEGAAKGEPIEGSEIDRRKSSFRNYLNRAGPQMLGSRELPESVSINLFDGKIFVLSGVLEYIDREDAKSYIESHGGRCNATVSKKTNYLIAGRDAGESKMAKAKSCNVEILSEDKFFDLVDSLAKSKKIEEANQLPCLPQHHGISSVPHKELKPAVTNKAPVKVILTQDKVQLEEMANEERSGLEDCSNTLMWVDKYKPKSLKNLIGQQGNKSNAVKLLNWLQSWHKNKTSGKKPAFSKFGSNDGAGFRAALLSGPPGVGKTTTAQLVCKELKMSYIEFNSSDKRSKKSLEEEVAESLQNYSLSSLSGSSKKLVANNHCILMDEVDGMAGNEDRGGLQQLVSMIKTTKHPIICMCNDRNHSKMRTLASYTYDLRFQRPRIEQIKGAMMSIAFKEKIKIAPNTLVDVIEAANRDIRQVLHNLSMWCCRHVVQSSDQLKKDAQSATKDIAIGPFDVCRKIFSADEKRNMTLIDKSDLFFQDYSLIPLMVQENYWKSNIHGCINPLSRLRRIALAADSIMQGDIVSRVIRSRQSWHLLPACAMFASVIPGELMNGHLSQQISFAGWFGRNSTRNKCNRLLQELTAHMSVKTQCNRRAVALDYLPYMRKFIVDPLLKNQAEAIAPTALLLADYDLMRSDIDSIIEISQFGASENPLNSLEPKLKAALTRAVNKNLHHLPYALVSDAKKRKVGNVDMFGEDDEDVEADEGEEETVNHDAMIKQKSRKAKPKDTATNSKKGTKNKSTKRK